MRNLQHFPDDCFSQFTTAVDNKTDAVSQARLRAAYVTLQSKFDNYDMLFGSNDLEALIDDGQHTTIKADLLSLYTSTSSVVNHIRGRVESLQSQSIRYTCQNCTVEPSETIDHLVPESEFPEYAVHPKNLMPSCSTCNGFKGIRWRIGQRKNFINFYLDLLPNVRYLYVDVFIDVMNEINFRYRLKHARGINSDDFRLLLSHFTKLNLLRRMQKAAISHFSEFQNSIRPRLNAGETKDSLTLTTLESCTADRASLGLNHWKPTMIEALVNSQAFWNTL